MTISRLIKQKSYETIAYALRRHVVTIIPGMLVFLVLSCLPIGIYFLMGAMFPSLLAGRIFFPLSVLCGSVYYLSVLLFLYSYFISFYLDLTIITNDRMIDIDQNNLFSRTIIEGDLYQIQDASSTVEGFVASMFNYGDVTVQTAGPVPKFVFHNVPNPHGLRQALLELASADKKFHSK